MDILTSRNRTRGTAMRMGQTRKAGGLRAEKRKGTYGVGLLRRGHCCYSARWNGGALVRRTRGIVSQTNLALSCNPNPRLFQRAEGDGRTDRR